MEIKSPPTRPAPPRLRLSDLMPGTVFRFDDNHGLAIVLVDRRSPPWPALDTIPFAYIGDGAVGNRNRTSIVKIVKGHFQELAED